MSTDTLGLIFNSSARIKIMRLFLLNQNDVFAPAHISSWTNVPSNFARKELLILSKAGFIKRKKERKDGKTIDGWIFDSKFEYVEAMHSLLFGTEFVDHENLAKKFKRAGKIRLLLLSGIFNDNQESRLDLLLVGDNMKRATIEKIIRSLEAEIGKEVAYAAFETQEFIYRASMYDKLIRDIIDLPHKKIVNVGGLLEQIPQSNS